MKKDGENAKNEVYFCIDLKSFFASVECVERGLDPMTAMLAVADAERGEGTVCLAVTPAMKAAGVKNRCRVFEIPKSLKYIKAEPRMQKYIEYSAQIYSVYLEFVCPDDIHIYSIDEVFIYITPYLKLYKSTPSELAQKIMSRIYEKTGIRAACGIGTNLYLCKIALDIEAKHKENFIAELTEQSYRERLWCHRPLTDFWRIGKKTAAKLQKYGISTMKDITETDEDLLYGWFGVDAELLIDHAWGIEPTRMEDIKAYRAKSHSISSGQVLMRDYTGDEAKIIISEMADSLCLDLVRKNIVCSSVSVSVLFSGGEFENASQKLKFQTSDSTVILNSVRSLYDSLVYGGCTVRKLNISYNNISQEDGVQYSLFDNTEALDENKRLQGTVIKIKEKYGPNAILKGVNYTEVSTARARNSQIGGHKSGKEASP